ncbi:MAG TPA: hypothetical protein VKS22_08960 [Candidatus Binataceae bacterium]|nr:hypothetical protein [Candidatus Binataceae bacterium]
MTPMTATPTTWRRTALWLALVFVAAFGAGCGVKSAPLPPELARPERILDLRALADPHGIKLAWSRPIRLTGGHSMRDLSGFVILRAEGDAPMVALVKIPVTDQQRFSVQHEFDYLDAETVIGDRYRYQVVSETSDGYTSDASNEVGFTRVKPLPPPNPATYALPTPAPLP